MKFLNLTEGTFPINLAFEIESLDVPNIGKRILLWQGTLAGSRSDAS